MLKSIAFTMTLALIGAPAFAQTTFESLDDDGDGSVSKDEYYGIVGDAGVYADLDYDSDGFIDENEFEGIGLDDDYETWDIDNNDYVDSGEFYEGYFGYYDEDEDGHWNNGEWDDAGEGGVFDF